MRQTNLNIKLREKFIKRGVKMTAPETVFFSKDTKIGKNVIIEPYVVIGKKVRIENNVKILAFSHLEGTTVGASSIIGPFARLRPGTKIENNSKVGNFVEIKKSTLKKHSKVNHLSYIGDSIIGKSTNVGAGTITCNYDGINKNKTIIEDNVFIGSNSSLVAPLKIKKNAIIGAGSVITKNVNRNSLALTRTDQVEKKNYKRKKNNVWNNRNIK